MYSVYLDNVLYVYNYFLDLEWRIIYVGSAESMEHDQVLDTILVGPVPGGKHMFVFEVWLALIFTE